MPSASGPTTTTTHTAARSGSARRLWCELAVLTSLLASFLTIPLPVPHLALGGVWAGLVAAHVTRNRQVYRAVLRRPARTRTVTTAALLVSALAVLVTGVVQWVGVVAAIPGHAASSMLLLLLAGGHATRRLRRDPAPTGGRQLVRRLLAAARSDRAVLLRLGLFVIILVAAVALVVIVVIVVIPDPARLREAVAGLDAPVPVLAVLLHAAATLVPFPKNVDRRAHPRLRRRHRPRDRGRHHRLRRPGRLRHGAGVVAVRPRRGRPGRALIGGSMIWAARYR